MKILYAADFGILPGSFSDYPARITALLQSVCPDTYIKFEQGRYDFLSGFQSIRCRVSNSEQTDSLKAAILMQNCQDLTLDWQGSELLFHDDLSPFVLSNCQNITLKNFSIDWGVPFSTEATVVHSNESFVDVIIDSEIYPYQVQNNTLLFLHENGTASPLFGALEFDASTLRVRAGAGDTFPPVKASLRGPGLVRLHGDFKVSPIAGNILVLRHGKRIHPGLFADNSTHICLEHIRVHSTCGLGMLFQFCEDIDAKRIAFATPSDTRRKVLTGHDDGLHFSNCRGQIRVENCVFSGLMDDPINVHGTSVRILEKCSPDTLRCAFIHPQSYGFAHWAKTDDTISFLNRSTLAVMGTAKTVSFEFCKDSEKEFIVKFSVPVPDDVQPGDALENLSNTPSFICRYNHFGSCRARGVLVSTPQKVIVEQNLFESSGSAVLIAGDANEWYESGACRDVTIRGNTFLNCCTSQYQFCYGVISIAPEIPARSQNPAFHTGIQIIDNTFMVDGGALLYAQCCSGLVFRRNMVFQSSSSLRNVPFTHVRDCENPVIEDNQFTGVVLSPDKLRALLKPIVY